MRSIYNLQSSTAQKAPVSGLHRRKAGAGRWATERGRPRRSVRGFTLVEVVISVSIMVVICVALGEFFLKGSRAMSSIAKSTHTSMRLSSVMDRIVSELVSGRFASLDPPIPVQSQWIRFQKVIASGAPPVYGNPVHIELVEAESNSSDNLDNDGDGLVDETGVRIWEDYPPYAVTPGPEDSPTLLATELTSDGLKFTREGAVLLIELTFQAVVERGETPTLYHLQSGVRMRNSN